MDLWFTELYENASGYTIKIKETLFSGKSRYQKLDILQTEQLGKMMVLDGLIMLTEANEFSYHEMIAHVPMTAHPNPERVLIIGGGDGGTAREVLKHDCVKECVMVEIDELVIEKSKEFFPQIASAFDSPKLNLLVQDGFKYIEDNKNAFDVVIIDSTDPIGPAEPLFSEHFYKNVNACLKSDGLMSAQSESPYLYNKIIRQMYTDMGKAFPVVKMYTGYVPFYPTGMWSFAFASKKYYPYSKPRIDMIDKIDNLQYFNKEIYSTCFALPNFVRKILDENDK
ncbi:MAG: polyamine aminopropyltransferase [Flexistipes sinusarabici]|uniref:Polyamine aminopropyltransferase n=1 Tax=Flexistipes sinusarabici TaxID=2352 RepID=A0A5D0MGC9_FLESI|nr:polyamine aminopropyltransferase [Flexistipes sinusarabici]TYB32737.1 MAG: polyamine aminopropyltransferase [Flexistipes sinusarabici]